MPQVYIKKRRKIILIFMSQWLKFFLAGICAGYCLSREIEDKGLEQNDVDVVFISSECKPSSVSPFNY